ncbi:hypothetical protein QQS21_004129 [Conoideocrella luteorostrata]|uniref:Bacteriophage T5 Orf172 DNA-binding domain-containing protein n=1 Tax=Conoideocrella luteorostrata TaxID=1105319 RepID=A0AAJ0G019_9HYPO|nr:hypothetical protein QQS21_004129 [Conoideocrella luteorostrata]
MISLKQAKVLYETAFTATSLLDPLAQIAENCCCARHHRNKMFGSGLALKLAHRWANEIRETFMLSLIKEVQHIKTEHILVSLASDTFARYQVFKGETLSSKLLSTIDKTASTIGSLYFYTHKMNAFSGMVKIGYSSRNVQSRLDAWAECGHGQPVVLGVFNDVRHPERVESLVHFELMECWYAQRWCKVHEKPHIEWFKVNVDKATAVARQWCKWMRDANPYDRRGCLKTSWKEHINFLVQHENPVTAEAMVQVHEIEMGSQLVDEFIDDGILRRGRRAIVKREPEEKDM